MFFAFNACWDLVPSRIAMLTKDVLCWVNSTDYTWLTLKMPETEPQQGLPSGAEQHQTHPKPSQHSPLDLRERIAQTRHNAEFGGADVMNVTG